MLEQYIGYGTTYYFLSLSYKTLEKKKITVLSKIKARSSLKKIIQNCLENGNSKTKPFSPLLLGQNDFELEGQVVGLGWRELMVVDVLGAEAEEVRYVLG